MGNVTIKDSTIWVKHIENADAIVDRIIRLKPDLPIALKIDGNPVLFRKMKNGAKNRPTLGIRPDEAFTAFWNELYRTRRGEKVSIESNDEQSNDPYLAAISSFLSEWDSPEDNDAYNDLPIRN